MCYVRTRADKCFEYPIYGGWGWRCFAPFDCLPDWEKYAGMLHGGITAAILDAAMMNALSAHGITAVTARLSIHYSHPVLTDRPAQVRAWLKHSERKVHEVRADVLQEG